ncbi:MAG: hypothetical protein WC584_04890 [Candidatus Pacearchaeota archaeon]
MEYIFVCYAGVNRSPIAVDVARTLARKYNVKDFKAEFLGIAYVNCSNLDFFKKKLSTADIVFALDQEIMKDLIKKGISAKRICNLNIEDNYPIRGNPKLRNELEEILTEKLEPFFKKKENL